MGLSAEQKRTLREGYAQGLARSVALRHERLALLRRLEVQMLDDDGRGSERVSQVHAGSPWHGVVDSVPLSG